MLRRKFTALALAALLATPSLALAKPKPPSATSPFTNIAVESVQTLTSTGAFVGTLDVLRFATDNGQLVAVGTITGTLTNTATNATTEITEQVVRLIVNPITGTCEILTLELGPVDLNLLGLVIHLDPIELTITAVAGPGNLLGNLLCAIAGLLDQGGPLSGLVRLLNQLLNALR